MLQDILERRSASGGRCRPSLSVQQSERCSSPEASASTAAQEFSQTLQGLMPQVSPPRPGGTPGRESVSPLCIHWVETHSPSPVCLCCWGAWRLGSHWQPQSWISRILTPSAPVVRLHTQPSPCGLPNWPPVILEQVGVWALRGAVSLLPPWEPHRGASGMIAAPPRGSPGGDSQLHPLGLGPHSCVLPAWLQTSGFSMSVCVCGVDKPGVGSVPPNLALL